ncbi:hypothetical protein MRX96_003024 [Rhipicephalus microplus]
MDTNRPGNTTFEGYFREEGSRHFPLDSYSGEQERTADEQTLLNGVQASVDGTTCDAYQQALAVLDAYFAPPRDAFCIRARFWRRVQESDKTSVHFILALQWLANNCNFGTTAETMIQDRILHGLRDRGLLR